MTRAAGPAILVTGATGYVGGRLLRALESDGRRVRCLARRPEFLRSRTSPGTEIAGGDVLDPDSLDRALEGIETAFYLVHSMGSPGSFEAQDRRGAASFAAAASRAGVRRTIYLGGLGESRVGLSAHLRSRHEVGEILRGSRVPTVEFRASIVIGSGSLSFELIRALVERLPVMDRSPVGLHAGAADRDRRPGELLVAAPDLPLTESRIFEIGGADRASYGELMMEYARQRGLRRLIVPVPFLTPRLSSLWLGLVTPLYARVGRALIESMRHATLVQDPSALSAFAVRPVGYREAIGAAQRGPRDRGDAVVRRALVDRRPVPGCAARSAST